MSGARASGPGVLADRVRGPALYAAAVVLLAAGAGWWWRAAPDTGGDGRVPAWREAARRALPDVPEQVGAGEVVLAGGFGAERVVPVDGGAYVVELACAGRGYVRVRVSRTWRDSGRAVPCAVPPRPSRLQVGLAESLYLGLSAESDATVVFRFVVTSGRP